MPNCAQGALDEAPRLPGELCAPAPKPAASFRGMAACNAHMAHAAAPNLTNLARISLESRLPLQHIIMTTMCAYRFSRILSRRRTRPATPCSPPACLPASSWATQLLRLASSSSGCLCSSPTVANCCQLIQFAAAQCACYCDFVRATRRFAKID